MLQPPSKMNVNNTKVFMFDSLDLVVLDDCIG